MYGLKIDRQHDNRLYCYSNSDWAGNLLIELQLLDTYYIISGTNPINWSSKQQHVVARSSTEAEYRVVASALTETNWVMNLL